MRPEKLAALVPSIKGIDVLEDTSTQVVFTGTDVVGSAGEEKEAEESKDVDILNE